MEKLVDEFIGVLDRFRSGLRQRRERPRKQAGRPALFCIALFTAFALGSGRASFGRDLNGDGVPDLLFQNSNSGAVYYWMLGNGGTSIANQNFLWTGDNPSQDPFAFSDWHVVGTPDLNNDTVPDVVLQNSLTGAVYFWQLSRTGTSATIANQGFLWTGDNSAGDITKFTNWMVVGTSDLNGDSTPDLVLQNSLTGAVYYWLLGGGGTTIANQGYLWTGDNAAGDVNNPSNWSVVGLKDLNNDSVQDLVLQNSLTGAVYYWQLSRTNTSVTIANQGYLWTGDNPTGDASKFTNWTFENILYPNGGKAAYVLLSNDITGAVYFWQLNAAGNTIANQGYLWTGDNPNSTPGQRPGWRIVESIIPQPGQQPYIVLQNLRNKAVYFWQLNNAGTTIVNQNYLWTGDLSSKFTAVGLVDLNGDGTLDLGFEDYTTGAVYYWLLGGGGTFIANQGFLYTGTPPPPTNQWFPVAVLSNASE